VKEKAENTFPRGLVSSAFTRTKPPTPPVPGKKKDFSNSTFKILQDVTLQRRMTGDASGQMGGSIF